jgi:membrane associated rhomboid family serine protease
VPPVTPWVRRLIVANVIVFFLQQTSGITGLLEFIPRDVFREPWTILTYMFVHGSITHILFNMLGATS